MLLLVSPELRGDLVQAIAAFTNSYHDAGGFANREEAERWARLHRLNLVLAEKLGVGVGAVSAVEFDLVLGAARRRLFELMEQANKYEALGQQALAAETLDLHCLPLRDAIAAVEAVRLS